MPQVNRYKTKKDILQEGRGLHAKPPQLNFRTSMLVKTHTARPMGWLRSDRDATAGQIWPLTFVHDSGWENIWRREGGGGVRRGWRRCWMTPVERVAGRQDDLHTASGANATVTTGPRSVNTLHSKINTSVTFFWVDHRLQTVLKERSVAATMPHWNWLHQSVAVDGGPSWGQGFYFAKDKLINFDLSLRSLPDETRLSVKLLNQGGERTFSPDDTWPSRRWGVTFHKTSSRAHWASTCRWLWQLTLRS